MDKEEFVKRMMFMEKVKKIKKAKDSEKLLQNYKAERRFESEKGKPDTYKRINVNYDR